MEEREKIWCCTDTDESYPERLKVYASMPKTLYIKGRLPGEKERTAAIVGARECTHYGAYQAFAFAKRLAECGVQIISGLARGVDVNAHKGALKGGGRTFAVMGCGADICYPVQNRRVYEEITEKGGILSEFAEGTPPYGSNFPRRNRIISGLADLLLVVEAKERSGSLITAGYAMEQGKPVYAVPGRVGDALSQGCNRLIADGAGLADSPETLLAELGIFPSLNKDLTSNSQIRLARQEEMVYSCLDFQPRNIEEICCKTGLETKKIVEILLKLELEGLIEEPVKNYYAKAGG